MLRSDIDRRLKKAHEKQWRSLYRWKQRKKGLSVDAGEAIKAPEVQEELEKRFQDGFNFQKARDIHGTHAAEVCENLGSPNQVITFYPAYDYSRTLEGFFSKGVSLVSEVESQSFSPPEDERDHSAGLIVQLPDGRFILATPRGGFAGYQYTFPKGRIDADETPEDAALREFEEETGLKARITGDWYGDYRGTSTWTRYFSAELVGGEPSDMSWETERVLFVPQNQVESYLSQNENSVLQGAFKDFLHQMTWREVESSWEEIEKVDKDASLTQEVAKANASKNRDMRYLPIPFDNNRVRLQAIPSDYINASFVNCEGTVFISCQAPIQETIGDHLTMLYEQTPGEKGLTVMVTNLHEGEKEKSVRYWPRLGETWEYPDQGGLKITFSYEEETYPIVRRTFQLERDGKQKTIIQLQLRDWPDKDVVQPETLAKLLNAMENEWKGCAEKTPAVVHCRLGIGRTSDTIMAYGLWQRAKRLAEAGEEVHFDVCETIRTLKRQRRWMIPDIKQGKLAWNTVRYKLGV